MGQTKRRSRRRNRWRDRLWYSVLGLFLLGIYFRGDFYWRPESDSRYCKTAIERERSVLDEWGWEDDFEQMEVLRRESLKTILGATPVPILNMNTAALGSLLCDACKEDIAKRKPILILLYAPSYRRTQRNRDLPHSTSNTSPDNVLAKPCSSPLVAHRNSALALACRHVLQRTGSNKIHQVLLVAVPEKDPSSQALIESLGIKKLPTLMKWTPSAAGRKKDLTPVCTPAEGTYRAVFRSADTILASLDAETAQ